MSGKKRTPQWAQEAQRKSRVRSLARSIDAGFKFIIITANSVNDTLSDSEALDLIESRALTIRGMLGELMTLDGRAPLPQITPPWRGHAPIHSPNAKPEEESASAEWWAKNAKTAKERKRWARIAAEEAGTIPRKRARRKRLRRHTVTP